MNARWRFVIVSAAAVMAALSTARLGLWQLDRAAEKRALQASIDARAQLSALEAATLARSTQEVDEQQHRNVRLTGHWVQAHTVFLDNRQMQSGRPGFFVVTPLLLADGRAVLVQRGWVPRDAQDRTRLPAVPTPEANVQVVGRVAPPPQRLFEFSGADAGRIRQNLDLEAFAHETGLRLAPLSVLQTETPNPPDGLQRDWPAPATGLAKHQGYAFQWFGLSALVVILYVWFQLIRPIRIRGTR